ncbi:MAG: thiamine-phosphate kinase, partial [Nitrososphaerales archaeon]
MELKSSHFKQKLLNEEETISLIWQVLSRKQQSSGRTGSDPYGDDVAWLRNEGRKKLLVIKSDMFVSETDAPPQMTPKQMASKALTSCVSDFAAKGVRPEFALVSLALQKGLSTRALVSSLALGFDETSRKYGVRIIGGDTNSTRSGLVIDCTLGGFTDTLVLRRQAKPGDLVGVSGSFGIQSAGLRMLLSEAKSTSSFKISAVQAVLGPKARLKLGLSISKYLTSCIDSSDGLAISLYHLAESSLVNLKLEEVPLARGVRKFAEMNSLDGEDLALFGGEEYELVFTFERKYERVLLRKGVLVIGSV